jgi:hypothetical protein
MPKIFITTRKERAHRASEAMQALGEYVALNVDRIRVLMQTKTVHAVVKKTGISRRVVGRLRDGTLTKMRYQRVRALATYFGLQVSELEDAPSARKEDPGTFAIHVVALQLAETVWRSSGGRGSPPAGIIAGLEMLLDGQGWVAALGDDGTPILTQQASGGFIPRRGKLKRLEKERIQFAEALAAAITLLCASLSGSKGRPKLHLDRSLKLLRGILKLRERYQQHGNSADFGEIASAVATKVRKEVIAENRARRLVRVPE